MLITMSISRAPARSTRARLVGLDLGERGAEREADHARDRARPLPLRFAAARGTQTGLMHTLAKPCSTASAHSLSMSAAVASGLSSVWSM